MDLYKAIILLSTILIIPSSWWAWDRHQALQDAQRTVRTAPRDLKKIGELVGQLHTITKSTELVGGEKYRIFFERQIHQATSGTMSSQNFSIGAERSKNIPSKKAQDVTVQIKFEKERKPMVLNRSVLDAILAFCEQPADKPKIWKLRKLHVVNEEYVEAQNKGVAPPRTVSNDKWRVNDMVFARRKPIGN